MNHSITCFSCAEESSGLIVYAKGEINSKLIAVCKCSKGHTYVVSLWYNLFDVLYTSAVNAYLKECYSESVMSFAASLERVYEFFIKASMLNEGISIDVIEEFWKDVKHQSERQLGAFCLQYAKATKKRWVIDSNQSKFRNAVIHKGHISTSKEVKEYAEYITSCHVELIKILKSKFNKECEQLKTFENVKNEGVLEQLKKEH